MSDRKYFFDGSQPVDYNEFIEGLAEITSLKQSKCLGFSKAKEAFK
jgi:hypothetical protein